MTLPELSKKMAAIDFAMLTTRTEDGSQTSRPMSNNGDVEYRGDSYFFASKDSQKIAQIERETNVGLTFTGAKSLLGAPGIFIAVEGKAELIREKSAFKEHWTKDLERWFSKGVDSPELILIKVRASLIRYWDGEDADEIRPGT